MFITFIIRRLRDIKFIKNDIIYRLIEYLINKGTNTKVKQNLVEYETRTILRE